MTKIEHANSGQMIWQLDEINSAGLLNKFTLGDGNSATMSHTPERLLNVKSTPGVQVYDYNFDPQNGNLLARKLSIGNNVKEEGFAYDNLERLEQQRFDEIPPLPVAPAPLNISYDPQGKILSKTDAGLDYRYNINAQLKKIQQQQSAISLNEQNITYTPFRTVNSIEENGIELTYTYGPDQSRYKGIWKNNGTQYRKRIYASGYEINEETVNGVTTTQSISYVSSPSGLCALYVEENGSGTFYYVHTDQLGSITSVTNTNGNIIARQNFDAWGRRRKVQDYSYLPQNTTSTDNGLNNNGTLPKWLYRGYTGHEMLDEFALINMNARLYDPVVGMFLSPDNYIQAPGNTQNYNRYAYCLNNPLKYSDPSGNFFQLAIIRGVIDAIVNRDLSQADPLKSGTAGNNAIKIWHGFFTSPEFIHQLPQNIVGMIFSHVANLFGNVQSVNYYDKSVVVKGNNDDLLWGWHKAGPAMTVGNYVIGDRTIEADPYNPLFQHEFGHVLQSRDMHWGYLSTVAIPSLFSKKEKNFKTPYREHDFHPVEQDANRRAFLHFNSKEEGFYEDKGWDNSENILDVNGDFKRDIIDFKNSNDLEKLDEINLNSLWFDRVGFWMFGRSTLLPGLFYAHYYNNYYEP